MSRHLRVKFDFLCLGNISPRSFPENNVFFFYFSDCTDRNASATLNWGAGGIRDLTLDANKIEPNVYVSKIVFS